MFHTKKLALLTLILFATLAPAVAEDYAKLRTISSHSPEGRVIEIRVNSTFSPGAGTVIPGVYKRLKELQKGGRMEYAWPDASSITIEVSYNGEILKSVCNPKMLAHNLNDENREFYRLWTEAYDLLWNLVKGTLELQD
jgi:hypothetical protein